MADKKNKEAGTPNKMIEQSVMEGVEADIYEEMPDECKDFLIKYHNSMDDRRDLMTQVRLVKKAESAWRHHRQSMGATGRALSSNYEGEYWRFVQNRYVNVWRLGPIGSLAA